ncbi:MAG: hypothetical protein BM564_07270 [Bacteroidetes bacterium MedPE-SWsnd-G2]|mgnify:CR=1 FL=1|nr:MAG: hypothetical protein BM564_07270 [Bacteroidetes bacterium MedPE-SWsnd-G2]
MLKQYILFIFTWLLVVKGFSQAQFQIVTSSVGLEYSCGNTYLGSGVSFVDFNSDGWDDISLATDENSTPLFFQNNNGVFEPIDLGLPISSYQNKQLTWVDFDNDGDKDLFITSNTDGNILFQNNGELSFIDVTEESGLETENISTNGVSWGDVNNDGYLDLFMSNRGEIATVQNHLYLNNGDGTFSNNTEESNIMDVAEASFCSVMFDFNNDGWLDIFVANDKPLYPNRLYKNDGDGTFTEVGESSGAGIIMDAMTATVDDYNNDSYMDIYITNTQSGNILLENNGDETFTDVTSLSGTDFNSLGWGAVFFDAENDTDLDLYVSSMFDGSVYNYLSSALYINNGDETFDICEEADNDNDTSESYANAIGDFNNDGLIDFVVTNNTDDIFLFYNNSMNPGNWLKLNFEGVESNRDGIGTLIELGIDENAQYRMVRCGEGYLAQNSLTQHFGVGDATEIDYLKISWPSGQVDWYYDIEVNQSLSFLEGQGELSIEDKTFNTVKMYPTITSNLLNFSAITPIKSLVIYDGLGQKINSIKGDSSTSSIDVSALSTGLYTIVVVTTEAKEILKFVKR